MTRRMTEQQVAASVQRHLTAGAQLSALRAELVSAGARLVDGRPEGVRPGRRYAKLSRELRQAIVAIEAAQHHGDEAALVEHRDVWCPHWYYPAGKDGWGPLPHNCPNRLL